MGEHIIGTHIKRVNRNLLVVNAVILAVLALIVFGTARYLYNFFFGPFSMSRQALLATQDPGKGFKYYVTVEGDAAHDTGVTQVEQRRNKYTHEVSSERTTA